MDKFNKAVEIYKSKYKMQVDSLLKFIRDKIESPPEVLSNIQQLIMTYHSSKTESITEQQLQDYLHLVAAAQANINIFSNQLSDVRKYSKIKFKSKKEKEPIKEDEKVHKKDLEKEGEKEIIRREEEKKESHPHHDIKKDREKKELNVLQEAKRQKEEHRVPQEVKKEKVHQQVPQEVKKEKEKERHQAVRHKQEKKEVIQVVNEDHKPKGSHGSPKKQKQPEEKPFLGIIEENVVEEDRTSIAFRPSTPTASEEFFIQHPEAQIMQLRVNNKPIQIRSYDKFGQNYFQPIIKFRMVYKDKAVYRRYTEFENLMKYLNRRYQGFILPELPQKEGIKSNLSYFRGVDEAFLNDRQNKLQDMMNVLMASKFISQDQILLNFITLPDFQIDSGENDGALNYLRSLGQIAFNAKELKNYGMAYYNYFKSFKRSDINTKVTDCYKLSESTLSYCLDLQNYRTSIIANFDKRREIFKELQADKSDRTLTITEFDKQSASSASEVRNLDKEMNKYYQLKSQQSWLGYLIGQKEYERDNTVQDLKRRHKDIEERIIKMQKNLVDSIEALVEDKKAFIKEVGTLIMEWRKSIHP